ncbi:MAG: transglutaminase family protein, partial [Sulfurovum sp.]|nr:transglutaminase family protein [Sulfurovum sp.]
ETLPPVGKKKLFGTDASHAWFSVYIPNAGWVEFDPTNNIMPKDQHILLGSGRDYHDISPLKGVVMSSGNSRLSVMVDVRKEEENIIERSTQSQSQSQQ